MGNSHQPKGRYSVDKTYIKYPELSKYKTFNESQMRVEKTKLRKRLIMVDMISSALNLFIVTSLYFEVFYFFKFKLKIAF
jgi:hypothetical protein